MHKLWRPALLALFCLGAAAAAPAPPEMLGFVDAAALSKFCSASGPDSRDARLVCLSYVTGAVDQLLAEQALGPAGARRICVPAGINAQDLLEAIGRYTAWSSSAKGVSAANFIRHAVEQAYPCGGLDNRDM